MKREFFGKWDPATGLGHPAVAVIILLQRDNARRYSVPYPQLTPDMKMVSFHLKIPILSVF